MISAGEIKYIKIIIYGLSWYVPARLTMVTYTALFSATEQTHCSLVVWLWSRDCRPVCEWPPKWCAYSAVWLLHARCHVNLLPSRRTLCIHHGHHTDCSSTCLCGRAYHWGCGASWYKAECWSRLSQSTTQPCTSLLYSKTYVGCVCPFRLSNYFLHLLICLLQF